MRKPKISEIFFQIFHYLSYCCNPRCVRIGVDDNAVDGTQSRERFGSDRWYGEMIGGAVYRSRVETDRWYGKRKDW